MMASSPPDAGYDAWLAAIPLGATWTRLPERLEVVDPCSVRDRLVLYRMLNRENGATAFFGDQGERHIFWGYAAQLHWQWESGRLGIGREEDRIADDSWWGAMNATLSLLPARAAQRAGFLEGLGIAAEKDPLHRHAALFASATDRWADFFEQVAVVRSASAWEAARTCGWRAHVTSIEAGVRVFAPLWQRMPAPERAFGRGWTRMVDFFGSAALRTDLEAIARFRSSLPPRPLLKGDHVGSIRDFDEETNEATRRIVALAEMPAWRFALRRWLWNRSMRDPLLREESLDILFGERGSAPEIQRRFRRALLPGRLPSA